MQWRWRPSRRHFVLAGAASLSLGLLAAGWAASRITAVFEARERNTVSRLLGRAYPLSPGVPGSAKDLTRRLDRLGYHAVRGRVSEPGAYSAWGGTVEVSLRPFRGPEGERPATVARVQFGDGAIASVEPSGAVLEPETISVFSGPNIEERDPIDLSDCPKSLIDAILAVEDRRFFHHPGLDPAGIARAFWSDLTSGNLAQGGSTLTQQLAKNLFFSGDRTLTRKGAEAFAAIVLEARYSKERILRAYVNEIYLGQRGPASVRGVARASRHYFGKNVGDLNLAESALLAGLIRAPGVYNPFLHPDRAKERRDAVLHAMQETGAITEAVRRDVEREPIRVKRPTRGPGSAPDAGGSHAAYVADLVRQDLEGTYGSDLSGLGLRVYTTLDPVYQEEAERAVAQGLGQLERQHRSLRRRQGSELQAALVSVDLDTGGIVAMVGGREFGASQFNRAMSAHRQPGSLFKPVVYLAGLTHPGEAGRDDGGRNGDRKPRKRGGVEFVSAPGGDDQGAEGVAAAASRPGEDGEDGAIERPRKHHWWQHRRGDEDQDEEKDKEVPPSDVPAMPLTAATILMDEPYEVQAGGKTWSPHNDDDIFRGPVTVQRAIEESLNVPTARAAAAIGLARVAAMARSLGINSTLPEVPSLALGAAEVTPLEMAAAFSTIAHGGRRHDPFVLLAVGELSGALRPAPGRRAGAGSDSAIAKASSPPPTAGNQAVPPEAAHVMTALLEGVLDYGTGRSARDLGFAGVAAGKTGTSDAGRDLWFCGYTPRILTLVWVGFDDGGDTGLTGSRGALPIWVDYMQRIGADSRAPFKSDGDLAWAEIDPTTGGLARHACPESRLAPFVPGTEPTEKCTEHRSFWERWFD
jgi:membrane peptidoglycan carboxypeptidase